MNEDHEWLLWIQEEVRTKKYFTVHYSLKKYAAMGGELLDDLMNGSTDAFVYGSKSYDKSDPLVNAGWEPCGRRYKLIHGETTLTSSIFFNLHHSFVFTIDPNRFDLERFFSVCSSPYIVTNVRAGMVNNAWSYAKKAAMRDDKLIFCKVNSSPPSFVVVGGENSAMSALELLTRKG